MLHIRKAALHQLILVLAVIPSFVSTMAQQNAIAANQTEDTNTQLLRTLWDLSRTHNLAIRNFYKELQTAGKNPEDIDLLFSSVLSESSGTTHEPHDARSEIPDRHWFPMRHLAQKLVIAFRRFRTTCKQLEQADLDFENLNSVYYKSVGSNNPEVDRVQLEYLLRSVKRDIAHLKQDRKESFYEVVMICGEEARPMLVSITEDPTFAKEQRDWVVRR